MRFTEQTIENINNALTEKKKNNRLCNNELGIGVNLSSSINGASAFINNWQICEVDKLNRMIEELTMLKEAIEEETGLIL